MTRLELSLYQYVQLSEFFQGSLSLDRVILITFPADEN